MRTRVFLSFVAPLACLLVALPSVAQQALTQPYPTAGTAGLTRLDFTLLPSVSAETAPAGGYSPANGYFRVRIPNGRLLGWLKVSLLPTNPATPAEASFATRGAAYPIVVTYDGQLQGQGTYLAREVPQSVRDNIQVKVRLTARPVWAHGGVVTPYVTERTFAPGQWEYWRSSQPGPMRLAPDAELRWIHQDIDLVVEVALNPSILDSNWAAGWASTGLRYTKGLHTLQQQTCPPDSASAGSTCTAEARLFLRATKPPVRTVAPFLVPVAMLGRPPGAESWSRFTATSGFGATYAVYDQSSTSVTTQTSYGIGPISWSDPETNTYRAAGQGTTRTIAYRNVEGWQTTTYGRNGTGDLMLALCYPSFDLYQAPADMDFVPRPGSGSQSNNRICPSLNNFITMGDLLTPRPPTPGQVTTYLSPAERAALVGLNPLLTNPRAALDPTRFILMSPYTLPPGVTVKGGSEAGSVTKDQVVSKLSQSSTTASTSSLKIPIGALSAAAIGVSIPLNISSRTTETTTISVEFTSRTSLERSEGVLVEYEIKDPEKWLHVEVYYDTWFGGFVFRDITPAETLKTWADQKGLRIRPTDRLEATRLSAASSGFALTGSLRSLAPQGGLALIQSADGKLRHWAGIIKETGNFAVAGLPPGTYTVSVAGQQAPLSVSTAGAVNMGAFTSVNATNIRLMGPVRPAPELQRATPTPSTMSSPTPTLPSQAIVNRNSGRCVDVSGASPADRAVVLQLACGGAPSQQWRLDTAADSSVRIVNAASGRCMQPAGGAARIGGGIEQFACSANVGQRWKLSSAADGTIRLTHLQSGACLDIAGGSRADGAPVQLHPCQRRPGQLFRLQAPTVAPRR